MALILDKTKTGILSLDGITLIENENTIQYEDNMENLYSDPYLFINKIEFNTLVNTNVISSVVVEMIIYKNVDFKNDNKQFLNCKSIIIEDGDFIHDLKYNNVNVFNRIYNSIQLSYYTNWKSDE